MVMWYWSADTLFLQVSIDHNTDVLEYEIYAAIKGCMSLSTYLAGVLPPCCVTLIFTVHVCPQVILLAMITMRKSIHGFPFFPFMSMVLHLVAFQVAGAPLLIFVLKLMLLIFLGWIRLSLSAPWYCIQCSCVFTVITFSTQNKSHWLTCGMVRI